MTTIYHIFLKYRFSILNIHVNTKQHLAWFCDSTISVLHYQQHEYQNMSDICNMPNLESNNKCKQIFVKYQETVFDYSNNKFVTSIQKILLNADKITPKIKC